MSQNSNNNTEIKKAHAINMKFYKIIRKRIPFLENEVEMMQKWRFFESETVSLREV